MNCPRHGCEFDGFEASPHSPICTLEHLDDLDSGLWSTTERVWTSNLPDEKHQGFPDTVSPSIKIKLNAPVQRLNGCHPDGSLGSNSTDSCNHHRAIQSHTVPKIEIKRQGNGSCEIRSVSRFRLGDMVWGKVKSHPWWPGQIFDPACASSLARKSQREGHVLVAFFGDGTFGWFPESDLIHFERSFVQKAKQTTARNFVTAVEDALDEVGRRIRLGLTCACQKVSKEIQEEKPTKGRRELNLENHLSDVKNSFQPAKFLSFVKSLARAPFSSSRDLLWNKKAAAQAHAVRAASFTPCNSSYKEFLTNYLEIKEGDQSIENDEESFALERLELSDDEEGPYTPDRLLAELRRQKKRKTTPGAPEVGSEIKNNSCRPEVPLKEARNELLKDNVCVTGRSKAAGSFIKNNLFNEKLLDEKVDENAKDDKSFQDGRLEGGFKREMSQDRKLKEDVKERKGIAERHPQDTLKQNVKNIEKAEWKEGWLEDLKGQTLDVAKLREGIRTDKNCLTKSRLEGDLREEFTLARSEDGLKWEMVGESSLRRLEGALRWERPGESVSEKFIDGTHGERSEKLALTSEGSRGKFSAHKGDKYEAKNTQKGKRGRQEVDFKPKLASEKRKRDLFDKVPGNEKKLFSVLDRQMASSKVGSPKVKSLNCFVKSIGEDVPGGAAHEMAVAFSHYEATLENKPLSREGEIGAADRKDLDFQQSEKAETEATSHLLGEETDSVTSSFEQRRTDSSYLHAVVKKSKGFKRLVKSLKAMETNLKLASQLQKGDAFVPHFKLKKNAVCNLVDERPDSSSLRQEEECMIDHLKSGDSGEGSLKDRHTSNTQLDAQNLEVQHEELKGEDGAGVSDSCSDYQRIRLDAHADVPKRDDNLLTGGGEGSSENMNMEESSYDRRTQDEAETVSFTMENMSIKGPRMEAFGCGNKFKISTTSLETGFGNEMITTNVEIPNVSRVVEMQVHEMNSLDVGTQSTKQRTLGNADSDTLQMCLAEGETLNAKSLTQERASSYMTLAGAESSSNTGSVKKPSNFRRLVKGSRSHDVLDENSLRERTVSERYGHCQVDELELKKQRVEDFGEEGERLKGSAGFHHDCVEPPDSEKCSISHIDRKKVEEGSTQQYESTRAMDGVKQFLGELFHLARDPLSGDMTEMPSKALKLREAVFQRGLDCDYKPFELAINAVPNQDTALKQGVEQVLNFDSLRLASAEFDIVNERVCTFETKAVEESTQKRVDEDYLSAAARKIKTTPSPSSTKKASASSISLRPTADANGLLRPAKEVHKQLKPVKNYDTIINERNRVSSTLSNANKGLNEPVALLMKFPQGFALPSESQLRAMFVRFGSLSSSGTRIYCKTGCAQVVFRHARNAETAFRYAQENNIFGQASVSFKLKQVNRAKESMPLQPILDSSKVSKCPKHEEKLSLPTAEKREGSIKDEQISLPLERPSVTEHLSHRKSQSSIPLKSCLKKVDDQTNNVMKNVPRVTFQLSCGAECEHSSPSANYTNNIQSNNHLDYRSGESSHQIPLESSFLQSPTAPNSYRSSVSASDIGDRMITLLQQVSALVGSSGLVL